MGELEDLFDVPTDEDVEPECPSCYEEGTLRPTLSSVDGQSSASMDPMDIGLPIDGVFLALECKVCGWGEHVDAQLFAGPDPTAEGVAVSFTLDDPETALEAYAVEEGGGGGE